MGLEGGRGRRILNICLQLIKNDTQSDDFFLNIPFHSLHELFWLYFSFKRYSLVRSRGWSKIQTVANKMYHCEYIQLLKNIRFFAFVILSAPKAAHSVSLWWIPSSYILLSHTPHTLCGEWMEIWSANHVRWTIITCRYKTTTTILSGNRSGFVKPQTQPVKVYYATLGHHHPWSSQDHHCMFGKEGKDQQLFAMSSLLDSIQECLSLFAK